MIEKVHSIVDNQFIEKVSNIAALSMDDLNYKITDDGNAYGEADEIGDFGWLHARPPKPVI